MQEAACETRLSAMIAGEVALVCGCWKADAPSIGKGSLIGGLLGESVDDLQKSIRQGVKRGISCCCQARWYDGYLNNTLTLCHVEMSHAERHEDIEMVEKRLQSMPFQLASRRTWHRSKMYLVESRILKLELDELNLIDDDVSQSITEMVDRLVSAFKFRKEGHKCHQLSKRLATLLARRSGA